MKNTQTLVAVAVLSALLTGCGSSSEDDSNTNNENNNNAGTLHGPYSTGTANEAKMVYIDLSTGKPVELTAEQAAQSTEWDLALTRQNVFLNQHKDHKVGVYHTGNNADFYDEDGKPIVDKFTEATLDSELDDFTAINYASIPVDDSKFYFDQEASIIDQWYTYNMSDHTVSANTDNYFIARIANNDEVQYSKFSVSALTQDRFVLADLTLTYANQLTNETLFGSKRDLTLDFTQCSEGESVYIDLLTGKEEFATAGTATIDYSLVIPCGDGGAKLEINIADAVTAAQDFTNTFDGVDPMWANRLGFQPNKYTTRAFSHFVTNYDWAEYGIAGQHKMWSQFGVYIIKAADSFYKLQFISYYDENGDSGAITFRSAELSQ